MHVFQNYFYGFAGLFFHQCMAVKMVLVINDAYTNYYHMDVIHSTMINRSVLLTIFISFPEFGLLTLSDAALFCFCFATE